MLERYRYVVRTAPAEAIERAHEEADGGGGMLGGMGGPLLGSFAAPFAGSLLTAYGYADLLGA